ncbi:unnamed protein product [Caenorhabditis sp. 36 PRJEB53466]|nr:unnamed protein product [Caenorhabditis sp. 36 PRJEB53466]
MANENTTQIWEQFLDAAKRGTKKGGIRAYKTSLCKNAIKLSDKLLEHGPIYGDRYDIWVEYLGKVCTVLEADDGMIQRTVREYFLSLHSGEIAEFAIKFTDKVDGTSIGNICDVVLSGQHHRFYIKCHQRDPRSTSLSIANRYNSLNRPFIQEMYTYKLLSLICVGGEVHFPLPITSHIKKALYIATEEVTFTVAKKLTLESANVNAMLQIHFLQCILRLGDIGTNGGNFGQSDEGKPVIVDFWIVSKDDYLLSDAEIEDFWDELQNCNSRLIANVLKNVTKEKRKGMVQQAVENWNLMNRMDEAKNYVEEYVIKNGERIEVTGDLNRYVRDVKCNIDKMIK